jgi:hypothetical protein
VTYFCGKDLEIIESLVYQPELKPAYDLMRDALIWADERPEGLSREGYEKLIDLWAARSFIHKGTKFSDWTLDPEYFGKVWEEAISEEFEWPGFNRLKLSQQDEQYYESQRQQLLVSKEI